MTLPDGVDNLTLDGYAVNGGALTGLTYDSWGRDMRRYTGNSDDNVIDLSASAIINTRVSLKTFWEVQ